MTGVARRAGTFVAALLATGAGAVAGMALLPVAGAAAGTFAGAFLLGLAVGGRPLVEAGLAAAAVGTGLVVAAAVGNGPVATLATVAAVGPALLVSALLTFATGAFGAHFGDDLRDGLTEPLPTPAPAGASPAAVDRPTTRDRGASEGDWTGQDGRTHEDEQRDERRSTGREGRPALADDELLEEEST
jgi:hypothetical protein